MLKRKKTKAPRRSSAFVSPCPPPGDKTDLLFASLSPLAHRWETRPIFFSQASGRPPRLLTPVSFARRKAGGLSFPSRPPRQSARAARGAARPQNTLRVRVNHSSPHARAARHGPRAPRLARKRRRPRAPRLARKRRRHPAALAANARLVTRLPVARLTLRQRHAILRAESHSLLRNSAALRPARRCHLTMLRHSCSAGEPMVTKKRVSRGGRIVSEPMCSKQVTRSPGRELKFFPVHLRPKVMQLGTSRYNLHMPCI